MKTSVLRTIIKEAIQVEKIQRELALIQKDIKQMLARYKASITTPDEKLDIVAALKDLNARKKDLDAKLNTAIETMYSDAELEDMDEELKGNQYKIDMNKNNRIDSEDFENFLNESTLYKKGDELTIDMGDGPEQVIVLSDFSAGASKTSFITLKRDKGAPYTITLRKLNSVLVNEHYEKYITSESVNERIYVDTRRYVRSHGKKPRGGSHWAFYFDDKGGDPIFAPGRMNYADAVKWAKEEAKKAGKRTVYVGESINEEYDVSGVSRQDLKSILNYLDVNDISYDFDGREEILSFDVTELDKAGQNQMKKWGLDESLNEREYSEDERKSMADK